MHCNRHQCGASTSTGIACCEFLDWQVEFLASDVRRKSSSDAAEPAVREKRMEGIDQIQWSCQFSGWSYSEIATGYKYY